MALNDLGGEVALELLGLDAATQAVYRAFLSCPDADLDKISELAGIDRAETEVALDRLAGLALVSWEDHEIGRPRLNDPDAALSALVAQRQSEIAQRQLEIEESRLAVAQLLAARSQVEGPDSTVEIERIHGVEAVRAQIEYLARTCRDEVWSFNPGGAQSAQSLMRSRPLNAETLGRGVRMRAIFLDSVRNDQASVDHAAWLVEHGAEVRTLPELPMRMLIVDRSTAVVPMDDRDSSRGALLVTGRGMVAGLAALFVMTWKAAQPLGPRPSRRPGLPSAQETQALRLWAQGATDGMVARSLGVSERTVRRISETLADRLGARSRFEAGVRAMEAGWLTDRDLI